MSFTQRNAQWDGQTRTFLQFNSRSSSPRIWIIQVVGNKLEYWWGQQGGALQHAEETSSGVNHGKSNYVSPEAHALELAREKCRKQDRSGYREVGANGEPLDALVSTVLDFDNLPPSLCFYKPDNSMGSAITKKAAEGKVLYTRKRNGLAFILARGVEAAKLYSRRMLRQHDDEAGSPYTWDDRFPHIVAAATRVMPQDSILLGELVMDRGGKDDFAHVQSLTKSLTPQAQIDMANGSPSFYMWDVAFWNGEDLVSNKTVLERYMLINQLRSDALLPIEIFTQANFPSPESAIDFAKKNEWEGFVVVDPDGVYGDKAYNFKGKPDRPGQSCAKLKPEWEADFVALWDPSRGFGETSTKGRYATAGVPGIKSVALYQYDKKGNMVFISNCASGMTEEMKQTLAKAELWPRVWEVAYRGRRYMSDGDETNALDFPSFVRERPDKLPGECVDTKL